MPGQEIDLGKRLRNDLFCVEWNVKPQLNQSVLWLHQHCVFLGGTVRTTPEVVRAYVRNRPETCFDLLAVDF